MRIASPDLIMAGQVHPSFNLCSKLAEYTQRSCPPASIHIGTTLHDSVVCTYARPRFYMPWTQGIGVQIAGRNQVRVPALIPIYQVMKRLLERFDHWSVFWADPDNDTVAEVQRAGDQAMRGGTFQASPKNAAFRWLEETPHEPAAATPARRDAGSARGTHAAAAAHVAAAQAASAASRVPGVPGTRPAPAPVPQRAAAAAAPGSRAQSSSSSQLLRSALVPALLRLQTARAQAGRRPQRATTTTTTFALLLAAPTVCAMAHRIAMSIAPSVLSTCSEWTLRAHPVATCFTHRACSRCWARASSAQCASGHARSSR